MGPGKCPYFFYEAEAGKRSASAIMMFPYCTHRHSPAPRSMVLHSPRGSDLLKCGGDLDKCQIPSHLQMDLHGPTN